MLACHGIGSESVKCDRKIGPYDCCSVVQGDCLELMANLPSRSVQMIFADPPYGHNNHDGDLNSRLNDYRKIENKPIENDSPLAMRSLLDSMLTIAVRILEQDCCCCCCCGGGGPSPTFAWVAERMDRGGLAFFHSVIWDKLNPGLGWRYRRQHEMVMIAHSQAGKLRWADDNLAVPNIIECFPPRERFHPNEKPLELVEGFVGRHTMEGDLVLDPFAGSGTTLVAAKRLGRHFLGFEISEEYCRIARERIARVEAQPTLFEPKAEQLPLKGVPQP